MVLVASEKACSAPWDLISMTQPDLNEVAKATRHVDCMIWKSTNYSNHLGVLRAQYRRRGSAETLNSVGAQRQVGHNNSLLANSCILQFQTMEDAQLVEDVSTTCASTKTLI